MTWLLDTNVISELRKPQRSQQVVDFVSSQRLDQLYVSVVTFSEIRYGIEIQRDAIRRAELSNWLNQRVRPMFENRILPVDEEVMLKWRLLVGEGRKARHTYSQPDLIIAATALCHDLTIVTHDSAEFERARVQVFNPWT